MTIMEMVRLLFLNKERRRDETLLKNLAKSLKRKKLTPPFEFKVIDNDDELILRFRLSEGAKNVVYEGLDETKTPANTSPQVLIVIDAHGETCAFSAERKRGWWAA